MSWGDGLSTGVDSRASLTLNRRFGSHHFRPANFPHARRRGPGCRSVGASPASAHTLGRLLAVRRDIEVTRSRAFNEVHEDADEQVWVFRGSTPNVPIEWFIRLGEILYNLRSALDHLVWQLVLANGKTPGRDNSFPIIKNEDDWQTQKTGKRWMLKGVSQSAKAVDVEGR